MGRIVLGMVAGLLAMAAIVGLVEVAAHSFFPLPSDGGPIPVGVQLLVLAAYFLGALIGGIVAARISRARWTAWAIASTVAAGAIWSMFMIPHPQWMQIAAVVAPLLGGAIAHGLAGRETRGGESGRAG
jgi:ABC-type multidrug transport system permease subunit